MFPTESTNNAFLYEGHSSSMHSEDMNGDSKPAEELDENIPKLIFYTRVLNLSLGVCMVVASLLSLLTTDSATTGVLACYVVVFACLLCCFESGLQVVLRTIALNFGFMYSAKARSIFMIFVGTILFSFSLFGKIIGILMLANAGFNIYAIVKYPEYEEAQRHRQTHEIKDFLSANPAFTGFAVQAAGEAVANNPQMAANAAQSVFGGNNGGYSPTPTSSTVNI